MREPAPALEELASAIEAMAWDLALAVVDEGLLDDQIPSLQRLGRLGQLGDMPTFIVELSRELIDPQPERLRRGSPLAAQARDHARQRESFGESCGASSPRGRPSSTARTCSRASAGSTTRSISS